MFFFLGFCVLGGLQLLYRVVYVGVYIYLFLLGEIIFFIIVGKLIGGFRYIFLSVCVLYYG